MTNRTRRPGKTVRKKTAVGNRKTNKILSEVAVPAEEPKLPAVNEDADAAPRAFVTDTTFAVEVAKGINT